MATKAELQKALDEANAERSAEDQIVPEGATKAHLEAALEGAGVEVSQGEAGGDLKVTAPLVQVRIGDKVVQLSQGDIVPENASQESLDHLRDLGFISDGSAPAEK